MKTKTLLHELEEALQVVLDEVFEAARDFESKVKSLRDVKQAGSGYEGHYGELAAAAFLLKLKAEAAHETLEQLIEAEPDEDE
jgi:hypothetical protein